MHRLYISSLLFLLFSVQAISQGSVSVSGIIKDARDGETLIGASVEILEINLGTITNEYGYYGFSVPVGSDSLTLKISYIGYEPVEKKIPP
jgi:hypothetical protein